MERVNRLEHYKGIKGLQKNGLKTSAPTRVILEGAEASNGNSRVVFRIFSSGAARLYAI